MLGCSRRPEMRVRAFSGGYCVLKGMFCRRFTFAFTFALAFISFIQLNYKEKEERPRRVGEAPGDGG